MISGMPGLSSAPIQMLRGEEALQRLSQYRGQTASGADSTDSEQAKLKEVARGFDAYFARVLLKEMRGSVLKSSLFGEGAAGEIYQGMFDDNLADALSEAGGFGIGEMIERDYAAAVQRMTARQAVEAYEKQSESRTGLPLESAAEAKSLERESGAGAFLPLAEDRARAYSLEGEAAGLAINLNSNTIKRLGNLEGEAEK